MDLLKDVHPVFCEPANWEWVTQLLDNRLPTCTYCEGGLHGSTRDTEEVDSAVCSVHVLAPQHFRSTECMLHLLELHIPSPHFTDQYSVSLLVFL